MASPLIAEGSPRSAPIGDRFQVDALLGRGGMAVVYRVTEVATGRQLALKQLAVPADAPGRQDLVALFEREFLTLTQLSHPRVIEVYDYGVDNAAPYYTMELLDGGDLRERSPLPWRQACELLAGVCSSLALIHSRRLVHRDVGPANIRCTRDGAAKLIDFGAMELMGPAQSVVGTPAFVAPEVVHQLPLDGRTDLFSFGATLYFALTGQPPYPARTFSQLVALWEVAPPVPSSLVQGIPEALDSLVMSLLCLDRAMRPRAAFEVMQRLTAIAGLERVEPIAVSRAYLSTPTMVGRADAIKLVHARMTEAIQGRPGCILVEGASGMGRSRFLNAAVVEGKLLGATVLHAGSSASKNQRFAVARALASQLLQSLPEPALASARSSGAIETLFEEDGRATPRLRPFSEAEGERQFQLQKALADWMLRVAERHPLVVAIDDGNEIDESSAALLAAMVSQARRHRLLVGVTLETGAPQSAPAALGVLSSRSTRIELSPLTADETEKLLGSLFGDTQNLGLVSDHIHRVAAGNPRACLELATHLVDTGTISYDSGGWVLPVHLAAGDVPKTAEGAIRDRVGRLQPLARRVAEAQALANNAWSREDYQRLCPDSDHAHVDRTLQELVSNQVLVQSGNLYSLTHRGYGAALLSGLDSPDRQERHRALAELYDQRSPIIAVHHQLAGDLPARGLDRLRDIQKTAESATTLASETRIPASEVAKTIDLALAAATALGRPPREINDLRSWLVQLSVAADEDYYWQVAPQWLEQLKRDSGFFDWHALGDLSGPERLQRALATAAERYAATPASERVYPPDEAIRRLVYFVVASIAVGSRSMNAELVASLPPLLEPFAPLRPFVDAMRHNAIGLCEAICNGQTERARSRWIDVYERLNKLPASEALYVDRVRNAVLFAVGTQDVRMGRAASVEWAEILAADPWQRVNALYLRKVLALQQGDAEEAERYRRKAELLALQTLDPQMFHTTLPLELAAHALSGDLTGMQQVIARMRPLARRSQGWAAYAELADAKFQQLRGDLDSARAAFERCIAMSRPDPDGSPRPIVIWPAAIAGYLETLVGLGRHEEACSHGEEALATCQTLSIEFNSQDISRALALAEAKSNQYAKAAARLEALIAAQNEQGITGIGLGATYEARARVAIGSGDEAAFETYGKLTAREYRYGRGSALGARWERLMAEARLASSRALPDLGELPLGTLRTGQVTSTSSTVDMISAFLAATTAQERACRALKALCEDRGAQIGHLYLLGKGALTLVASEGADLPPDGLMEYMCEYFDGATCEDGDGTAALSGTQMASALTRTACFEDADGTNYQPVLMTSWGKGVSRYVGAAAFVDNGSSRRSRGATLVATLTAHLLQSGDTCGAP
jgi:tetratricopeptide (TPR) repeat protein